MGCALTKPGRKRRVRTVLVRTAEAGAWLCVIIRSAAFTALLLFQGLVGLGPCLAATPSAGEAPQFSAAQAAYLLTTNAEGLSVHATEGNVPAAKVMRGEALVGYVFSTFAVSGTLGYGGRPLDIHVGLTPQGRVAGALLARHEEPILVIGIAPEQLSQFVASLKGLDITRSLRAQDAERRATGPDHVAGATVSSAVMKDAVLRSARAVAGAYGLLGSGKERARIIRSGFEERTWQQLLDEGAVAHTRFVRGDVPGLDPTGDGGSGPDADKLFIWLYTSLLTPPIIGQNLLGRRAYESLMAGLGADEHAILVAASGLYSFKGTAWRQGGRFDRIRLIQGRNTITFADSDHTLVEHIQAVGAPELREIGVFRIPAGSGFDPTAPWRLELIVANPSGAPALLPLDYTIPSVFVSRPAAAAKPASLGAGRAADDALWRDIWYQRRGEAAILVTMLIVLTVLLFFHDLIVRNTELYRATRLSFLIATVGFLGIYAGTQLSVVNVVTFTHAVLTGFHWEQFLLDPMVFILWSFLALALLFWGRGVFCGWLCPFGALQELLNQSARRLGIRQIEIPWPVHERLWPIKYTLFLVILGLSFQSVTDAFRLAEVEPFKTSVALHFMRPWPYVAYALALLGTGLFIERFYCRYVCPLGAGLAIPAKLKIFDWLKRRPQCGRECRICATRCTVQAINSLGQINPNECIYCLKCQANYYDSTTCLPLKQRAQRRGGGRAASAPAASAAVSADRKPQSQEAQHE